jgi:natural product precursor
MNKNFKKINTKLFEKAGLMQLDREQMKRIVGGNAAFGCPDPACTTCCVFGICHLC